MKGFELLTPKDLIKASGVCHQWLNITQYPRFRNKIVLKLHLVLDNLETYSCRLLRTFHNVKLRPADLLDQDIVSRIAPILEHLESFRLSGVDLTYQQLSMLLTEMKNLKSLEFFHSDIEKNFVEDRYLENVKNVLANLTELSISVDFEHRNWSTLMKLFSLTSQLRKIEICFESYPFESDEAGNIQLTNIICSAIEKNSYTLKELCLRMPGYENTELISSIYQLNDLNLEYLNIEVDFYSTPDATISVESFLKKHKMLTTLKIIIEDGVIFDLNLLAETMTKLVTLEIRVDKFTNLNLSTIAKFKKLKILEVTQTSNFNKTPVIFSSVDDARKLMLRELRLASIYITQTDVINITEKLPNLEVLTLSLISMTNNDFQAIIKNLRKLKILRLYYKNKESEIITDFGISGFDSDTNQQTGVSIKELKNLEILEICGNFTKTCLIENLQFTNIFRVNIMSGTPDIKLDIESDIGKEVLVNCPKLKSLKIY